MNTKLKAMALLIACTGFLLVMSPGAAVALQDVPEKDAPLEALLMEYKEIVQIQREQLASKYKEGQLPYDEMLRAENELLGAELQVISDTQDRIAALEKRLDNCSRIENFMAAILKVGDAAAADMLNAKAERLMAQIELKREQLKK